MQCRNNVCPIRCLGLQSLVVLAPLVVLQWLVEWALPRHLPSSFTKGEAAIVGQGVGLFTLSTGQLYIASATQACDAQY